MPTPALTGRRADVAVFIGRFQMPHNGHIAVIRRALEVAETVCIVIGSSKGPSEYRNPFTYVERRQMIDACLTEAERQRVTTVSIGDHRYNDSAWIEAVQRGVHLVAHATHGENAKIVLIGHSKDNTSYYLKMFPTWRPIEAPNHGNLSSTPMRKSFFRDGGQAWLNGTAPRLLPPGVLGYLTGYQKSESYENMVTEYGFIADYATKWGPGPFVTVDACVIQSGHILLIKRLGRPYKGLWAMPGGFLDLGKNETLREGMLRELDEETNIKVPPAVLRGNVIHSEAFDDPFRDPRARVITHTFLINLPPRTSLPDVCADSDAADVQWWPMADLHEGMMAFDHHHITERMKGMLPKPLS